MKEQTKAKPESTTKDEAPKPKRRMPTAEERVAKLERELAEARERASAKDRRRKEVLEGKVSGLNDRIKDLEKQRADAQLELDAVNQRLTSADQG